MSRRRPSYMDYVTHNRNALKQSVECGCVYCLKMFNPCEITEWCSDYDINKILVNNTAICPHCGIDSVVPKVLFNYTLEDLQNWHIEGFSMT